jgi:hypothetical protein
LTRSTNPKVRLAIEKPNAASFTSTGAKAPAMMAASLNQPPTNAGYKLPCGVPSYKISRVGKMEKLTKKDTVNRFVLCIGEIFQKTSKCMYAIVFIGATPFMPWWYCWLLPYR